MHRLMSVERIPVSGPSITEKEIAYVTRAVTEAWYGNANLFHEQFEAAFSSYLGVRHAVTLPSCTSALHLSLLALGVGPGDEVIVPDITWIASSAPVSYVGATPVFADVDEKTWCLSATSFESLITPRTRAVIPVDLYGNMPELEAFRSIAAKHGISVIEDAAEAIGSELNGQKAGSLGHTGVFSFHGSKTLTTGEGGMLVTNDTALHERILFLRDHGRVPGDRMFHNTEIAYKYKMSSLQAALGLAQLERVGELVAKKREIFGWYREELEGLAGVTLNHEAPHTLNTYWMVTVVLSPELQLPKKDLMDALQREQIDSRPFFHPLSSLPAYVGTPEAAAARQRNTVSYRISPWGVNLPSALNLTRDQVRRVCSVLKSIVSTQRKLA